MAEHTAEEVDYQEEEGGGGEDEELYGDAVNGNNQDGDEEEEGPEDIERRVKEMEAELEQLSKEQQQVDTQILSASDKVDENSM